MLDLTGITAWAWRPTRRCKRSWKASGVRGTATRATTPATRIHSSRSRSIVDERRAFLRRARARSRGRLIADATWLARDLSNDPAGALTPTRLAEIAVRGRGERGLAAEILDEDAIVAARLGGLLGVAAGSAQPPRLIKLVYEPSPESALGPKTGAFRQSSSSARGSPSTPAGSRSRPSTA